MGFGVVSCTGGASGRSSGMLVSNPPWGLAPGRDLAVMSSKPKSNSGPFGLGIAVSANALLLPKGDLASNAEEEEELALKLDIVER